MTISTFTGYKLYGNNLAQSLKRTAAETSVAKDQAYYNANIGKVKTVGDLVNNFRLLSYATQAFGLSDMAYAKSLLTKVLTSNLSDPKSVANQLNDSRYTAFAHAFNFTTSGTLAAPLQSTVQQAATEKLFQANTSLGSAAAATATSSYASAMANITSIAQLEQSPAALGYVLIAYGIDPADAANSLEQTLESDLSDPTSFVNKKTDSGYLAFAQAFNVGTDGTTSTQVEAQSAASLTAMTNAYTSLAGTTTAAQKTAATETSYFTAQIAGIKSVSALVGDSRLLAYVTKAFGLPAGATKDTVTKALTSDLTVKTSFANTTPFPSYLALAKAFNFTTTGDAGPVAFQSTSQTQATVQLYAQRQTSDSATAAAATAYYKANIGAVQSVAELQKDPKLLAYAMTAYGIDPTTPATTVASILSGSSSVDSGYLALSQAFNVNTDGTPATKIVAQTDANTGAAIAAYMNAVASDSTTQKATPAANVAAQRAATTESTYYKTTIAGITTASALTSDSRLLAYVSKAYGLPSGATASTIQQALTSDLTDPTSYAKTHGAAYLALAKAFTFSTSGTAGSVTQLQSSTQQQTTVQLFQARAAIDPATAASATAYYTSTIGSIHSVAALQANARLMAYVTTAFGVDPSTPAATIAAVLQNTGGVDDNYRGLSQDFNVKADGTAAMKLQPQTAANTTAMTTAYANAAASDAASQAAAATETSYVQSKIGGLTSVTDLTSDSRLVAYVTQAYGLPSGTTPAMIASALTSDLSSSTSFAKTHGSAFLALAQGFNFATTGAANSVTQFQTTDQQQTTAQRYAANTTADSTTAAAATAYYNANIGAVSSVGDLESDPRLMSYVETAYGLDQTTSAATLSALLETKHAITDTARNASLLALKLAFNVDAKGNASNVLAVQSSTNVTATTTAYMANAKTDTASQTAAKAATAYYKTTIGSVTSISGLLADPKLVAYVEQAYGVPTTTSQTILRQVLTSDVTNPKSVANTMGTAYEQLAAAFDFKATGVIAPVSQQAQNKAQLDATNTSFIQQQMETEAGAQNPGIKLALYLQLNASKITDAYSILADKQLTQVFHTVLGLPTTASNADIDAQAKTITSQINLADLKDPKKLNAFIQRFSVLYDLNPPASTTPLTTANVLSGTTNSFDVTSLFGTASS